MLDILLKVSRAKSTLTKTFCNFPSYPIPDDFKASTFAPKFLKVVLIGDICKISELDKLNSAGGNSLSPWKGNFSLEKIFNGEKKRE